MAPLLSTFGAASVRSFGGIGAASGGGGAGSAILTTFSDPAASGTQAIAFFDHAFDSNTAYLGGKISSYTGGVSAYNSILLGKINLSNGALSDANYDDQNATGAWFPNTTEVLLDGNAFYTIGTRSAYKVGYSKYDKSSSPFGYTITPKFGISTSFSNSGKLVDSGSYIMLGGLDLFPTSNYCAVLAKVNANSTSISWARYYNVQYQQNDKVQSLAVDSSDNSYCCLQTRANTKIGAWKVNSSGTTQWGKQFDPDTNLIHSTPSPAAGTVSTVVDSSGNYYNSFRVNLNSSLSSNNRHGTYIIKLNTNGGLEWAKLFYLAGNKMWYNTGMVEDSSGNLLVSGYTFDYGATQGSYAAYVMRVNPSSGALISAKTIGSTSSSPSSPTARYFYPYSAIREHSSGNLQAAFGNNLDGTIRNSFFNMTSDFLGDFGDLLAEDVTSSLTVTTDSNASLSNHGGATSYSYSASNAGGTIRTYTLTDNVSTF